MKSSVNTFIEGEHYLNLGLITLAKEKFQQALAFNQQTKDPEGEGVCFFYLARTAIAEKNKDEALEYLKKARKNYDERGMRQMLEQIKLLEDAARQIKQDEKPIVDVPPVPENNPVELFRSGKFEAAIKIFASDVQKFRAQHDQERLAMSLLYLGQCLCTIEQDDDALTKLDEAHAIAEELSNPELIESVHHVQETVRTVKAQTELNKLSLTDLETAPIPPAEKVATALSKAEIFIMRGNSANAEKALHLARKSVPEQENEKLQALILVVESKLLRLKQKFDPALKVLQLAQAIAEKLNDQELLDLIRTTQKSVE